MSRLGDLIRLERTRRNLTYKQVKQAIQSFIFGGALGAEADSEQEDQEQRDKMPSEQLIHHRLRLPSGTDCSFVWNRLYTLYSIPQLRAIIRMPRLKNR